MEMSEQIPLEAIGLIEVAFILYLLNAKFPAKWEWKWQTPLAMLVIYGITRIPVYYFSSIEQSLSFFLVFFLYVMLFRLGKWTIKLFWTLLAIAFLAISVMLCYSFMSTIGLDINEVFYQTPFAQLPFLIFAKLVQGIVFFMLAHKRSSFMNVPVSVAFVLSLIPLFSMCMMVVVLGNMTTEETGGLQSLELVIFSFGVLTINICVLILYNRMATQASHILQQETQIQQNALNQMHYDEVSAIYEDLKTWRHDYHNHLQAIKGLLLASDYKALDAYLDSIETSATQIESFVQSGNKLIDAILNAKISYAKSKNISIDIKVDIIPNIKMESMDLCSLMGNLLDNSIEACQRIIDSGHNFISMDITTIKDQLGIEIRNSAPSEFKKSGSLYLTVKKERHHGIGLRQIDAIVEKYNGYVNRRYSDNVFETMISLPVC